MKVAWVTDSTAFVGNGMEDIHVVPMHISFGDREYLDGVDLTLEGLYEKLEEERVAGKTSQPSIGTFVSLYEKLAKDHDVIFSVHVSSHFSGTYASAVQAADLMKEVFPAIYCVDSKILSYPLTDLIRYGQALDREGVSHEEIKTRLEERAAQSRTFVMVGSLEQLHRSGRMSGLSFFLGSMLHIKPLLTIRDGKLSVDQRVRNHRKGLALMKQRLSAAKVREAFILYGLNREEADDWMEELKGEFPGIHFSPYPLAAVIGIHAGSDTLGISWFDDIGSGKA